MPILIEFPVGNELTSVGSLRDTYGYYSPSLFRFQIMLLLLLARTSDDFGLLCIYNMETTIAVVSVFSSNNYRTTVSIKFILL